MKKINNHADISTYTLLYQRLVGAKVIFGRKFMRHKQWEMNHVANYLLENAGNGRILDIGCGGGLITEPLGRLGADITGIDASSKNIEIAKPHVQTTFPNHTSK